MEGGTTMTANAPTAIPTTHRVMSEGPRVVDRHESTTIEPADETITDVDQSHMDADELLEVVKDNGFEQAFEFLADDDVVEGEEGDVTEEKDSENPMTAESEEGENELPDIEEEEKQNVFERIKELENKVTDLEEKNKELSDRLKGSEENLQLSLETMQQMALILKELIEEEEDERKKISLLEVLVMIMGNLMQEIAYPEDESSQERPQQMAANNHVNNNKKVVPYTELLKRMREKKGNAPVQDSVPKAA